MLHVKHSRSGPGLYVHVPFCEATCSYCDFYSVAWGSVGHTRFVEALGVELARVVPEQFAPDTVFIGGGTPSSLSDADLGALLDLVGRIAARGACREWSVENNPGSLTADKAARMVDAGVTRLSIGVQSFDDAILRSVGRVHDSATAREAVAIARDSGVKQVSIDLLFALPGQGLQTFERDLAAALELGVDHVSAYALLYEPGTVLTEKRERGLVEPEAEDVELVMLRRAHEVLGAAGFRRYEVSNFARPGAECLHNVNYWRNGEYIGVGPSATSYWRGTRRKNVADWKRWETAVLSGADPTVERESLSGAAALGESLMVGLRLAEGVDLHALGDRHGVDATALHREYLERLEGGGLVDWKRASGELRLTPRGIELADGIVAEFLVSTE